MLRMLEKKQHLLDHVRKMTKKIAAIRSDQRGVAAIEFALFGGLMSLAMLNVTDIAVYIYQRMQVEYATQMGARPPGKPATRQSCRPQRIAPGSTMRCKTQWQAPRSERVFHYSPARRQKDITASIRQTSFNT